MVKLLLRRCQESSRLSLEGGPLAAVLEVGQAQSLGGKEQEFERWGFSSTVNW